MLRQARLRDVLDRGLSPARTRRRMSGRYHGCIGRLTPGPARPRPRRAPATLRTARGGGGFSESPGSRSGYPARSRPAPWVRESACLRVRILEVDVGHLDVVEVEAVAVVQRIGPVGH